MPYKRPDPEIFFLCVKIASIIKPSSKIISAFFFFLLPAPIHD